jgi:hypothetical protein
LASATYEYILREVRRLPIDEQRLLRDEIDALLPDESSPTSRVRPGLAADLEALDKLATEIGAAWKTDRSVAEAVSDMRRELRSLSMQVLWFRYSASPTHSMTVVASG